MLQRAFQAAGIEIPIPFPRRTFEQAMQSYGSDKPDLRLPPFHVLEGQSWQLGLTFAPVAIHIPETGALSGSQRKELKDFGVERGLRVHEHLEKLDPKLVVQALD